MTTDEMIQKYHIALYSEDKLNVRRPPTGKTAAAEVDKVKGKKTKLRDLIKSL